ncbi:ESPR-type extended signal peptide-containing protein, partial [Dialister invisus]|uniref:ESPR-type extended signal peptide-containing protein n=1 Tax=Dialister invisus TaxID=218538 RepID=UPI003993FCEE
MNKIYKIIWSKVKNCYVVVSEITKNNRKGTTVKGSRAGAVLAALLLIHGAFALPAEAAGEVVWHNTIANGSASNDNMAHGTGAEAKGTNSIAWGLGAKASADGGGPALAWGRGSQATGRGAIALGGDSGAKATGVDAIATGTSTATGAFSIAMGALANANGYGAIAMGQMAVSNGQLTMAFGYKANATQDYSVAIGTDSKASGQSSMALGYGAKGSQTFSTALGYDSEASGANSMALQRGKAAGDRSLAASGATTETAAIDAFAIGTGAKASLAYSGALGSFSVANTASGAKGYDPATKAATTETGAAWVSTVSAIAVGDAASNITRQITGVAAGTNDTDAVNLAQLKKMAGDSTHYVSINDDGSHGGNYNNDGAIGEGSIAVGHEAKAQGRVYTAAEYAAMSSADQVNFIKHTVGGVDSYYWRDAGTVAVGERAHALGRDSIALGKQSNAISYLSIVQGAYAKAYDAGSIAIGSNSVAKGNVLDTAAYNALPSTEQATYRKITENGVDMYVSDLAPNGNNGQSSAVAVGNVAKALARGTAALGQGAIANVAGGVALGSDSYANTAEGETGYLAKSTDTDIVWKSTYGAVSIGDPDGLLYSGAPKFTRQITGLAAGTKDTDAVNVA